MFNSLVAWRNLECRTLLPCLSRWYCVIFGNRTFYIVNMDYMKGRSVLSPEYGDVRCTRAAYFMYGRISAHTDRLSSEMLEIGRV